MNERKKLYAVVSSIEGETGIYEDYEVTKDFKCPHIIRVKVSYEEEGQSIIDHGLGLLGAGYSMKTVNLFLNNRVQGKDKRNPVYYVVIGERYQGVFTKEERDLIPDNEKIYYNNKFYTRDIAMKVFDRRFQELAQTFYVVISNKVNGVFKDGEMINQLRESLDSTSNLVIEEYRNLTEAEESFNRRVIPLSKKEIFKDPSIHAYVDGSYSPRTRVSGYGYVLVYQGDIICEEKSSSICMNRLRHLNGELEAVMNSIMKAVELGFKEIVLHYDFYGSQRWSVKKVKSKSTSVTTTSNQYRDFIDRMKQYIDIKFVKIKSHSGVYFHDRADFLAKQAAGVVGLNKEMPVKEICGEE
ncbi:RNase H family protein [Bacillus subtilis]|uniref:RNase H family protein n=1 Tax=Bacillus subtilis TaxID=1423 RepID=UPI002DB8CCFA|nr:RNase H family protein [Bacillus subtilis]MEC2335176.1 reverse transcriptase-like protein [Bacillus subtilis]